MVATEQVELISELDKLTSLLESKLPGNVVDPENQRLVKGLQKDMANYFRSLDMALDWRAIEALYWRRVGKE